jgi:hypothetical protein
MDNHNRINSGSLSALNFVAFIALLMFLYHLIAPTVNLPEPSINALYWFLLCILIFILPYIRKITFKDFSILFKEIKATTQHISEANKEIKATKQLLSEAKNELMEARLRFDKTREELVLGYFEYLKGLPEDEQDKKKIKLTNLYLENMSLSERDLTKMLNKVGTRCEIRDEIMTETLRAIEQFQRDFGLISDGVFGYQTYAKLLEITRTQ